MKAMIMAAGAGTRLMPMTAQVPKPMVPMMNRPLMANTVELLAGYGFKDIIVNLHYRGEAISDYFGDGSDFGVNMSYSREPELLGTAGGVKNCQGFLDETFAVVSGDALTGADLGLLLEAHRRWGSLATIALKEVEQVELFGIVVLGEGGRVRSFQEKPAREAALGRTANTGIYMFEPEIFRYIPDNSFYDFGSQVFPGLVKGGAPFYGLALPQYWCDVGSLETYRQAHSDILDGLVPARSRGEMLLDNGTVRVFAAAPADIGQDVRWAGTVVLGSGCRVGDGASIRDTVIWDGTVVEEGAVIEGAIIGRDCRISRGAVLGAGSAVGSGSTV